MVYTVDNLDCWGVTGCDPVSMPVYLGEMERDKLDCGNHIPVGGDRILSVPSRALTLLTGPEKVPGL